METTCSFRASFNLVTCSDWSEKMGIPHRMAFNNWLVVEPYPSEKWWSSLVGMMTFPIYIYIYMYGKTKNVPNHQPDKWMGCWGLLGWLLIVSRWIIPENSLRLAPVRHWLSINVATKFRYFWKWGMPKPMEFNTHIMMVEFWMNWGTPILGNLRLGMSESVNNRWQGLAATWSLMCRSYIGTRL